MGRPVTPSDVTGTPCWCFLSYSRSLSRTQTHTHTNDAITCRPVTPVLNPPASVKTLVTVSGTTAVAELQGGNPTAVAMAFERIPDSITLDLDNRPLVQYLASVRTGLDYKNPSKCCDFILCISRAVAGASLRGATSRAVVDCRHSFSALRLRVLSATRRCL